ncbi:MAG TPA: serine O-acetyltransferase EpsC [Pirellulaceae bacterium]|nr:serine O-acetyltransferase EpsC [Pirellulaceae bacterium]
MSTTSLEPVPEFHSETLWNLDAIVADLRALREASLAARQRVARPVKLPSRKSLAEVVDGLCMAMFPNRLGSRVFADESIDFFVGHTIDTALRELVEQVLRELQFSGDANDSSSSQRAQAIALVREFGRSLPAIREVLETDIYAAYEGDPAARSVDEVLACYPGITAIAHYRIAHALHTLGTPLVARIIAELAHSATGIDIHPGAQIGSSFFIDHGTGVVIGETSIIGQRVRLYHGVTLGAKRFAADENGVLIKGNARHPIVEDDVVIYAGATILGRITLGRGSVIGGNVWLTRSVPPGSNISQAKVRSDDFDAGGGI